MSTDNAATSGTPDVVDAEEEKYEVHPKFVGDHIERIARFLLDNDCARIGGSRPDVAIVCGTLPGNTARDGVMATWVCPAR